jgi:hypothetical protein
VLSEGIGDMVASARQTLADPDWFTKLETGHADEIRLCEFTNYCEGLDQQHKQVTCQLWDREALNAPGVTLVERRQAAARGPPDWSRNDDSKHTARPVRARASATGGCVATDRAAVQMCP